MSQDEDEYAVEAILSHGYDKATGHLLYYVKWEGYDEESDNTWESVSNLECVRLFFYFLDDKSCSIY